MPAANPPPIASPDDSPSCQGGAFLPLSSLHKAGLVALLVIAVLFGAVVEYRCTSLKRRMTDVDVYFRAAWAIRNDQDLYQITNSRGWHYHYPPLLAILLAPLAEPPENLRQGGYLPFAASVAIWYVLSVVLLVVGVHALASAMERTSSNPAVRAQPPYCRRWWALRIFPSLICVIAIGSTLSRGQVNLPLVAMICLMVAAGIEGKGWRAGLWLAGAIALKIMPAFLLLYPLWRRDLRWLAGCAVGLVIMLLLIPAAVLGPRKTMAYNRQLLNVVVSPAVAREGDESRKAELTGMQATDNQSIMAAIHHAFSAHRNAKDRPAEPALATQIVHWGTGGVLIAATLAAARFRRPSPLAAVTFIGVLLCIMLLITPVCHLHYHVLAIPLFAALLAGMWDKSQSLGIPRASAILLLVYVLLNLLPRLSVCVDFRYYGSAMYANLALCIAGIMALYRQTARAADDAPAGSVHFPPA